MLRRLYEYTDRLNLPPAAYKRIPIPWLVDLDKNGRLLGFVSTTSGKKKDRGKEFVVPNPDAKSKRSSAIRPNLLADRADYALGVHRDSRTKQLHQAFVDLASECLAATGEPAVAAVTNFLKTLEKREVALPNEITPDQWVTFRVEDQLVVNLPSIQNFWLQRNFPVGEASFECIVCGRPCQPVKRHPGAVKGIPGGQPSGLALVSANKKAFESYGLDESHIAPTCYTCAERYLKAINSLLESEANRYRVGPLVYLFWTKEVGFSPVSLFRIADPEEVKTLIESAGRGREYTAINGDAFYATALSASGGRVVVRRWLETTVGEVRQQIARWFRLQRIVESDGEEGRPIRLNDLAASLYRDPNKDMCPNVPRVLLDVALQGGPLPQWLLHLAAKRNCMERCVTRPRAALIKMVLLSQKPTEGDGEMERIDLPNDDPAYHCGRLLAVLETIQRQAIPGIKDTVVDRFFGTASSAPASVFGRLVRGAQSHLGKLRKNKPGTFQGLQEQLIEIQARLKKYPKVLNLEQQGLFALGYYHQRAEDRAAARAYKQSLDDTGKK